MEVAKDADLKKKKKVYFSLDGRFLEVTAVKSYNIVFFFLLMLQIMFVMQYIINKR